MINLFSGPSEIEPHGVIKSQVLPADKISDKSNWRCCDWKLIMMYVILYLSLLRSEYCGEDYRFEKDGRR